MTDLAIKTKSLGIAVAQCFTDGINDANYYLAIGKVRAWANEASPDIPTDSVATKIGLWESMLFAKKITGNDVRLVIPRYNWAANTVYTPYTEDNGNLFANANTQFYVLTTDYNIYKCLENNQGANSTIMPTYTNPLYTNKTSDGYLWKYLYTLSRAERLRFLTDAWMPVRDIMDDDGSLQFDVQEAAVDGSILSIQVTSGGSGYTNSSNVSVVITGDGTNATGSVLLNANTNTVNSIVMTSPGLGYTNADAVISGGGGSGAVLHAVVSPPGGHGSDPVEELGGSSVMINMRIKDTESNKIPIGNDFRQIAIIKDPLKFGDTANVSANTVVSQLTKVFLVGTGTNYSNDEEVYQGGSLGSSTFRATLVSYDSANNTALLANTIGDLTAASLIGDTSSGSRFVSSSQDPELEPNSGTVLYINNIVPITRNDNQTEHLQIILNF